MTQAITTIRLASHDNRNARPWRTPCREESSRMKALLCKGPRVTAVAITTRSRTIGSAAPGYQGRVPPVDGRTGRQREAVLLRCRLPTVQAGGLAGQAGHARMTALAALAA